MLLCSFFLRKHKFIRQYTLAGEESRYSWKKSCIYFLLTVIQLLPSFPLSLFFNNRVYLCPQWGLYSFCVLFSPCVYSRSSTVTYLIFVTVTKVYTYRIDVYIQYIIQERCERRDSLCCTWLSLDWGFFLFLFYFISLDFKTVCLM